MCEQRVTHRGTGAELSGGEAHVVAEGEGARIEVSCDAGGSGVVMDADAAEIEAEAILHA